MSRRRVRRPTLIIAGDDDPIIPLGNARLMARAMPAARLRLVRGGGHLFLVDEPESVIDDIHALLDGSGASSVRAPAARLKAPHGFQDSPARTRSSPIQSAFMALATTRPRGTSWC